MSQETRTDENDETEFHENIVRSTTIPLYKRELSVVSNNFIDQLKSRTGLDSIPLKLFTKELEKGALKEILEHNPPEELIKLLHDADLNKDGEIDFEEFKYMLTNEENLSGHQADLIVKLLRKTIATISSKADQDNFEILKKTSKNIFCQFPPPLCMIILTIVQVLTYLIYDLRAENDFNRLQALLINSPLIYNPKKKSQLWRIFSYSLLHRSYLHLIPNMVLQVMSGFPLELLHTSRSVLIIYSLGVVTGSLGVNLIDPSMYLVGSSGGIFAIIMAYFAYFMMNNSKASKLMIGSSLLIFAFNIFEYMINDSNIKKVSMFCHFFGGLTGFLVGLVLYNNTQLRNHKAVEVVALTIYISMLTLLLAVYLLNLKIKKIDLGENVHVASSQDAHISSYA